MIKYRAGVLPLLLLCASQAEAEGVGGLLKGFKDKLDASTKQIQQKPSSDSTQANNAIPQASTPVNAQDATPVASATFDIKGIKLHMPVDEVLKLAKSSLIADSPRASCQKAKVTMQHQEYVMGDEVIMCREFLYFGQEVSAMNAYFIDGKLSYLSLGTFYSETDSDQELPAVFKALADKYAVKPILDKEAKRMMGVYDFTSAIKDASSNELFAKGELRQDMSGNVHKNVTIGIQIPGYRQFQDKRLAEIEAQQVKEQQAEAQRKQRDL